jgi:Cu-Zn family superoxide dismutase
MRFIMTVAPLGAALFVASCARTHAAGRAPPARSATAELRDAQGRTVGRAELAETSGGEAVRVRVWVSSLSPGEHGVHVHARGSCAPPDYASAGAHFNPLGKAHGLDNPAGPHAGDLPNLVVGADGSSSLDVESDRLTFAAGRTAFVPDSISLVVHAGRDDQRTDPSGGSGARVACGVFGAAAGRRAAP